ncbi:MAG: hypothetical protein S4CHLAM2_18760 [Chlamydiales bacterium]|nr:hypothetical protein [Chlamydiales bacterium]
MASSTHHVNYGSVTPQRTMHSADASRDKVICLRITTIAVNALFLTGGAWSVHCSTGSTVENGRVISPFGCPENSMPMAVAFIVLGLLGILYLFCGQRRLEKCIMQDSVQRV